jgi:hypothetical protein
MFNDESFGRTQYGFQKFHALSIIKVGELYRRSVNMVLDRHMATF